MIRLSDKVLSKLSLQRLKEHHRTVMAALSRLRHDGPCSCCGDPGCEYKYERVNTAAVANLESYKKKITKLLFEKRV